jgi:hypothetical protein
MMHRLLSFVGLVCLLNMITVSAQSDDVTAEGVGLGSNETESLMAAKRDAVEKGIGMILLSQTEIENFMLKRDMVITKTIGSVKNYEVISKNKTADGLFETRIKAALSKTTMHEDLASFHILLESMDKPKVMVIIAESNVGNTEPTNKSAENAIIKTLKSPYDFELVDPGVVAQIKASQAKMAELAGDAAAAASIGSSAGAEVVITGDAISRVAEEISKNLGGMKSVQADVTLRAINCTSGRIIASADGHGAKVHVSPNTAGSQALDAAAQKALEKLIDAIIVDWNNQINNGLSLALTVSGVKTFREKNAVISTLQSMPGVSAVRERNWNGQSALLEADLQYKGNANGFCEKADSYKLSQGGGSLLVNSISGNRIALTVQAN